MSAEQLSHHDFIGVYDDFAGTSHGVGLHAQVRYEKYNLSGIPREQWTELLGADANNLEHMRVTYQLTQAFVRYSHAHQPELLAPVDTTLLLAAAIIHDQGEAKVGDTSYGDKSIADSAREHQEFITYATEFTPSASQMLRNFLGRARDEIVFDSTSRLGRIFNAIERVGYLRTALRASQHVVQDTAGVSTDGLRWLVADVLSNQMTTLVGYASDYEAVRSYLNYEAPAISQAFACIRVDRPEQESAGQFDSAGDDFRYYNVNQQALKRTQFIAARTLWDAQV